MPSVRSRAQVSVGSSQWIQDENEQIAQFGIQEAEDFAFAARNEIEWLSEHMSDIFTKSQLDVTEIFKTPGKLRGKTPRTARKRNHVEIRQPLTDLFSTNARMALSPSRVLNDSHQPIKPAMPAPKIPQISAKVHKTNTDSGYHGMSEDEIDTDAIIVENVPTLHTQDENQDTDIAMPEQNNTFRPCVERATTTDGSFHSAREEPLEDESVKAASQEALKGKEADKDGTLVYGNSPKQAPAELELQPDTAEKMQVDEANDGSALEDPTEESRSLSQGSSPVKPLLRKSSLTFASLPAREPLTTKKSIGASVSRASQADQAKGLLNRGSFLGRFTNGKSLGATKNIDVGLEAGNAHKDEMEIDHEAKPATVIDLGESDGDTRLAKLHNKSSTQRLHDKISMLGKSQAARPTKSITAVAVSHPLYPELPSTASSAILPEPPSPYSSKPVTFVPEEDDDDWIKPPPAQSHQAKRPQLPKSTTADVMENIRGKQHIGDEEFGPGSYDDAIFREPLHRQPDRTLDSTKKNVLAILNSVTAVTPPARGADNEGETRLMNKNMALAGSAVKHDEPAAMTTPIKTPHSKQNVDGPISASKSKLQSIMKTARGLFTSSAGVSAQAKIEALSSPSTRTRSMFGDVESNVQNAPEKVNFDALQTVPPNSAKKEFEGRRTRSSTEKEERHKQQEAANRLRADAESKSARNAGKEPDQEQIQSKAVPLVKPTRQSPRRLQKPVEARTNMDPADASSSAASGAASGQPMGPPQTQSSQLQRLKDGKRPVKPAKEATSKPKPQTIRVGALSQQRIPLSNAALSSALHESLPSAQTRPSGLVKKPSNASIQTSASNSSLKSSVSAAATKPKALLAAERKKEQDEKEAQRKLEQKREIERKRAAQQEEMRQQERLQREEAEERQRERERSAASEDPKRVASRQLIEKRRLDLAKKDQQRAPTRPINESAAPPERTGAPIHRPELGGTRPASRLHTVQDQSRSATNHPPTNPARPAIKRVMEPDADDRPTRPQAGTSYQQNDTKRRRTGEEDRQQIGVRPTMAPPIRQSNIRKDLHKSSIFNNAYSTAPPPANTHQGSAILKPNMSNNTYQQHPNHQQLPRPGQHPHDMAKYTNARPPFADAPNPPAAASHKTPLPKHLAPPPSKPSPQFINGENIHLEEIPTDTESDDSPATNNNNNAHASRRPTVAEWVQSPNLRELIRRQEETMNPDLIFGPQQSPHMEEMFKDRHQRFRNRTSSAAWVQDRLTSEEIQRDVEARERIQREGGWTFGL